MEIRHTTLGTGPVTVLFDDDMLRNYRAEFETVAAEGGYRFVFLDRKQLTGFFRTNVVGRITPAQQEKTYGASAELRRYYAAVAELGRGLGATAMLVCHTGQHWHPEAVAALEAVGVHVALWTADDDSGTIRYCSLPYTRLYGWHFHVGIMHDAERTIADVLRDHGGNPVWIPLGAIAKHVNATVDESRRDIDVCYIGNVNPPKIFRLSKLKRRFGDRFQLFGAQGNGDFRSLKGVLYWFANKIFRLGYVKPLTDAEVTDVYARTKIGFNMHLVPTKGPSNFRSFELAANGAMLLCDVPAGLGKIFKDGEEAVSYRDIGDAIEKIEKYLADDGARRKIAAAGKARYQKEDYSFLRSVRTILGTIAPVR